MKDLIIVSGRECFMCDSTKTRLCPLWSKSNSLQLPIYVCKKCCDKCYKNKMYKDVGECNNKVW